MFTVFISCYSWIDRFVALIYPSASNKRDFVWELAAPGPEGLTRVVVRVTNQSIKSHREKRSAANTGPLLLRFHPFPLSTRRAPSSAVCATARPPARLPLPDAPATCSTNHPLPSPPRCRPLSPPPRRCWSCPSPRRRWCGSGRPAARARPRSGPPRSAHCRGASSSGHSASRRPRARRRRPPRSRRRTPAQVGWPPRLLVPAGADGA
jgi:hypothetical protein